MHEDGRDDPRRYRSIPIRSLAVLANVRTICGARLSPVPCCSLRVAGQAMLLGEMREIPAMRPRPAHSRAARHTPSRISPRIGRHYCSVASGAGLPLVPAAARLAFVSMALSASVSILVADHPVPAGWSTN
jgi:hypothetical protein